MKSREDEMVNIIKTLQNETPDDFNLFAIPGYLGNKLVGYSATIEDLKRIRKLTNLILESEFELDIIYALWTSIVVTYAKCFTQSQTRAIPKIEESIFDNNLDLKVIHEQLIQFRNTTVAHREETALEVGIPYIKFHKTDFNPEIRVKLIKKTGFTEQDLKNYIILFEFVEDKIHQKFENQGNKIYRHYMDGLISNHIPPLKLK
jgi:hypothetical protein